MLDSTTGDDPRPARGAVRQVPTDQAPDTISYSPDLDGDADPGEIVWAWVPFEDDPDRGKDRPLLVVGRHGSTLRALMLSSKEHDRARHDWFPLGAGDWDREGRASSVRLDRLYELGAHDIRREGAILDAQRFQQVAATLCERYGWTSG